MSYDIRLTDPVTGHTLLVDTPHHMTGGTYQLGGCHELWLNVTYNYSEHFRRAFQSIDGDRCGIRYIYGMRGAEAIPVLQRAIAALGDDADRDYWKPTEGNAKRALCSLLAMAQMRPDGVFQGD